MKYGDVAVEVVP